MDDSVTSPTLIANIEEYFINILSDISCGRLPNVWASQAPTLAALEMAIYSILYELQVTSGTCTLRDIYYRLNPHIAASQLTTNTMIEACALRWKVPRHALRVHASSRGFTAGCIRIRGVDCMSKSHNYCMAIPGDLVDADIETFDARYVVVIEKDCIFQRLVHTTPFEALLWQRLPCILITGCGFPDFATRRLVGILSDRGLPCFGVVDYNPSGVRILMTYRGGGCSSRIQTLTGRTHPVPIMWLGLHARALHQYPSMPRSKLTQREEKLRLGILGKSGTDVPLSWREEVRNMTFKAELQALYEQMHAEKFSSTDDYNPIGYYIEQQILRGHSLPG